MRPRWIFAVPVLVTSVADPAAAQLSARVHIDIPIGRPSPVAYPAVNRQVVVREYDRYRFGVWDRSYDEWLPVTVYYYDGYYYDYRIVPYAEPILVYRFRNDLFFAPRQREFNVWQERFRERDYHRDVGRQYRPDHRDGRDDDRNQRPRDDRNARSAPSPARDAYRSRPRPH